MFIFVENFGIFISKIQYHTGFLELIYLTKRMMECGCKVAEMTSSLLLSCTHCGKQSLRSRHSSLGALLKNSNGKQLVFIHFMEASEIDDN